MESKYQSAIENLCYLNDKHNNFFRKIINPVLDFLKVAGACLDRFTYDGRTWALNTNSEQYRYYALAADGYKFDPFCKDVNIVPTNIIVWDERDESDSKVKKLNVTLKQVFKISQGMSFTTFDEHGSYSLNLYGKVDDAGFVNRCLKETSLMGNINKFLLKELNPTIRELEMNMFNVSEYVGEDFYVLSAPLQKAEAEERTKFLIATGQLGIEDINLLNINIPRRERQCALLCLKKYTIEEMAKALGINRNSAGTYITSLKSRLGAKDKNDLIVILQKLEKIGYFIGKPFSGLFI